MNITIVRHGETIENLKGIVHGVSIGGTLSLIGVEQAKKVSFRLKDKKYDIIYSSDLKRAYDTACFIKSCCGSKIIKDKNLRERYWGKLEGGYFKDIKGNPFEHPEVESYEKIMKRAKEFYEMILTKNEKKILVVTHGGLYHALVAQILDIDFCESLKLGKLNNTCVSRFEDKKLKYYACDEHLSLNSD